MSTIITKISQRFQRRRLSKWESMKRVLSSFLLLIFLSVTVLSTPLFAKEVLAPDHDLKRAIEEYNSREFGAALSTLLKLKEDGDESELGAYYLGLIYKEFLVYDKAILSLKEAAWHKPPVSEAFYSLAQIYFDLNRPFDALGQIKNAEDGGVRPAYTAYLKGLILISIDKPHDAVNAFDRARLLAPGLSVAVKYQKNIAFDLMRKHVSNNE